MSANTRSKMYLVGSYPFHSTVPFPSRHVAHWSGTPVRKLSRCAFCCLRQVDVPPWLLNLPFRPGLAAAPSALVVSCVVPSLPSQQRQDSAVDGSQPPPGEQGFGGSGPSDHPHRRPDGRVRQGRRALQGQALAEHPEAQLQRKARGRGGERLTPRFFFWL